MSGNVFQSVDLTDGSTVTCIYTVVRRQRQHAVTQRRRLSKTVTDDHLQRVCADVVDGDGRVAPVADVQRRRVTGSDAERRLPLHHTLPV